tara:strand:+ start:1066 stop:2589 length:1524 start_codon:yes stop_codon:yes gene_type:complete
MSIDMDVQNTADVYRNNPGALQQKYALDQQLIDLLALQYLKSEQDAAAQTMQMQAQVPPATVGQQLEEEMFNRTKQRILKDMPAEGIASVPPEQPVGFSGGIASVPPEQPVGFKEGGGISWRTSPNTRALGQAWNAALTEDTQRRLDQEEEKANDNFKAELARLVDPNRAQTEEEYNRNLEAKSMFDTGNYIPQNIRDFLVSGDAPPQIAGGEVILPETLPETVSVAGNAPFVAESITSPPALADFFDEPKYNYEKIPEPEFESTYEDLEKTYGASLEDRIKSLNSDDYITKMQERMDKYREEVAPKQSSNDRFMAGLRGLASRGLGGYGAGSYEEGQRQEKDRKDFAKEMRGEEDKMTTEQRRLDAENMSIRAGYVKDKYDRNIAKYDMVSKRIIGNNTALASQMQIAAENARTEVMRKNSSESTMTNALVEITTAIDAARVSFMDKSEYGIKLRQAMANFEAAPNDPKIKSELEKARINFDNILNSGTRQLRDLKANLQFKLRGN